MSGKVPFVMLIGLGESDEGPTLWFDGCLCKNFIWNGPFCIRRCASMSDASPSVSMPSGFSQWYVYT